MGKRTIVEIDEVLCTGCGDCIPNCAEGALQIAGGVAKLVSDALCDGFGACLGHCPKGAIRMIEREAVEFQETAAVHHQVQHLNGHGPMSCATTRIPGRLTNWPVQLHLLNPEAPFLADSDLLLCADCVPFTCADFHRDFLAGHTLAIGCPKLDDAMPYLGKLSAIFQRGVRSLTILHMEVPCCGGLTQLAARAMHLAGVNLPVRVVQMSLRGEILRDVKHDG